MDAPSWLFRILTALIILVVGWWLAKLLTRLSKRMMERSNVEPSLISFGGNIIYIALLVVVVIATLSKLGVQTASLIAVVGAAGLAIGLALQGSLSNFASGVLIILLKPFKVGDYIVGAGTSGTVESIQLFNTNLKTPDNQAVFVPNSRLTGDNIVNYSAKDIRRVNMTFGVGYDDDLAKVQAVLEDIIKQDSRVLDDPEPKVTILEFADSSVNFAFRPWVKTDDYWDFFFDTNKAVKERFDAEGISIPYPQRDVHLISEAEEKK